VVTRANPRFHLVNLALSCCFVAISFVRDSKEKKPTNVALLLLIFLHLNSVATT
jgi:hypothetical protein